MSGQRGTFLGHLQSALAGPPPLLLPLLAAASGSRLGRWQGRELRHLHLSAARIWQGLELIGSGALQCLCRAWAGVRSWEETGSKAPHPFSLSFPGGGQTPRSSQNGCRGLGHPAVSNHFSVPWRPGTALPALAAVLRFGAEAPIRAPSPRAGVLSGQATPQAQLQLGVLGRVEGRRLQKSQLCSLGEVVSSRQTGVACRSSLGGGPATGPEVAVRLEPSAHNQPAEDS